jgi:hypothetical protein
MPLLEAAVSAIEREAIRTEISKLFQTDDTLYSKFRSDVKSIPIAYSIPGNTGERGSFRVPMAIQANGNIRQITGDGDDMGAGQGTQWQSQLLSPCTFVLGTQISWLAENATNSKTKALIDVNSQEFANSLDYFKTGLESQFQGDGTGALDTIPTTATISNSSGTGAQTSFISGVSNPNQFQDQQIVQFFAVGGAYISSATISYVDAPNAILWFSTAVTGITSGTAYSIMVNASSTSLVGAAGSSLLGLKAYQSNATTGTLNGVNRALFGGRLSTPTVNLSNNFITVPQGRRGLQLLRTALGADTPAIEDLFWYCGLDQEAAIENLQLQVTITNQQQIKGDESLDMGKKNAPATFMGRDVLVSTHATKGRIDGLCPKYWAIGEMHAPDLYEVKGQTVFPLYGTTGVASAHIFYYITSLNLVNSNPRGGVVFTNAGIPSGY